MFMTFAAEHVGFGRLLLGVVGNGAAGQVAANGISTFAILNCQLPPKLTLLHNTFKFTFAGGAPAHVSVIKYTPAEGLVAGEMTAPEPPFTIKRSTGSAFADTALTSIEFAPVFFIVKSIFEPGSPPKCKTGVAQYGEVGAVAGQVAANGMFIFAILNCQLPPKLTLLHNTFKFTFAGGAPAHVSVIK